MGDETSGSFGAVTLQVSSPPSVDPMVTDPETPLAPTDFEAKSRFDAGRRRFTVATLTGFSVAAVPFLWMLWNLWGSPDPLTTTTYENNYYDLQTRAMFHGHLWLAKGAIGIEAFVHGGHEFTYFGLFPSLIRMPILAVTSGLDGKLTAPFIMVAWLITGLFATLLFWRIRVLIRGQVAMGWSEAAGFGVLMATFMGGSVFMLLAATRDVFTEDLVWSVCLTVGSLFALLGVLERPSWGRVVASLALVLAANLDRVTTGWACVVAALLIAVWFRIGRMGKDNRRWWLPMLGVGLIPLVIGCAVNYAKFGVPFGVSNFDQVWTHVNAYRRSFLAANHNSEYGTTFIPSTLLAYLRPNGLRLTSIFPFVTLPAAPPRALAGVLFDRRYRTASLPASMPLLFLLSCWGLVTAFRPKPIGRVALTRILIVAGLIASAALFIWGYIAPRYLADFMPLLVVASAIAMVDIWRRLVGSSRSSHLVALGLLVLLALFTMAANIGIGITPNEQWDSAQALHFVEAQKAVSDVTGHPLDSQVVRGNSLPAWGPADQLFIVGNCNGLYISNGEDYSTVPDQQFQRTTWIPVERGHAFQHTYRITFNTPDHGTFTSLQLVGSGPDSLWVTVAPASDQRHLQANFYLDEGTSQIFGRSASIRPGSTHEVVVVTDPAKHEAQVTLDGVPHLTAALPDSGPVHDVGSSHSTGDPAALSAVDETATSPRPTLCEGLNR